MAINVWHRSHEQLLIMQPLTDSQWLHTQAFHGDHEI